MCSLAPNRLTLVGRKVEIKHPEVQLQVEVHRRGVTDAVKLDDL
jgi:hypothetical protein